MKEKTYTLQVGDRTLEYGYSLQYRKWSFVVNGTRRFCLLVKCRGNVTGHKVANVIAGAFKRHGELDNLARANISRLTSTVKAVDSE